MAEALRKQYPENYPIEVLTLLNTMAFDGGKGVMLLGSMSIRSALYAGDYDAYQVVKRKGDKAEALRSLAKEFQSIIKAVGNTPNTSIGDNKSGSIEKWRVMPKRYEDYNAERCKMSVEVLLRDGIITPLEAKGSLALLKPTLTHLEFIIAKKEIRYNLVRWTPAEVVKGDKTLRDGATYTLEEAFDSPTITKLDTIGFVQNNKYTEFSMIYEFEARGKVLNPDNFDIKTSLEEDILYFRSTGQPFKSLKREFALAKFENKPDKLKTLITILNSDLGRIYSIVSDIQILLILLEEHPDNFYIKKMRFEIDGFKARMGNIYQLKPFLSEEHYLLGRIEAALKTPSKTQLEAILNEVATKLGAILNEATAKLAK